MRYARTGGLNSGAFDTSRAATGVSPPSSCGSLYSVKSSKLATFSCRMTWSSSKVGSSTADLALRQRKLSNKRRLCVKRHAFLVDELPVAVHSDLGSAAQHQWHSACEIHGGAADRSMPQTLLRFQDLQAPLNPPALRATAVPYSNLTRLDTSQASPASQHPNSMVHIGTITLANRSLDREDLDLDSALKNSLESMVTSGNQASKSRLKIGESSPRFLRHEPDELGLLSSSEDVDETSVAESTPSTTQLDQADSQQSPSALAALLSIGSKLPVSTLLQGSAERSRASATPASDQSPTREGDERLEAAMPLEVGDRSGNKSGSEGEEAVRDVRDLSDEAKAMLRQELGDEVRKNTQELVDSAWMSLE